MYLLKDANADEVSHQVVYLYFVLNYIFTLWYTLLHKHVKHLKHFGLINSLRSNYLKNITSCISSFMSDNLSNKSGKHLEKGVSTAFVNVNADQ